MKPIDPKFLGLRHIAAIEYDDQNGGWHITTTLQGYRFVWHGTDPRKLDDIAALVDAIAYLFKTGQV